VASLLPPHAIAIARRTGASFFIGAPFGLILTEFTRFEIAARRASDDPIGGGVRGHRIVVYWAMLNLS
jgi:hypothetical protein